MNSKKKIVSGVMLSAVLAAGILTTSNNAQAAKVNVPSKIVIGWAPPDITGVFKTAGDYMQKAADDAKKAGLNVQIITRASDQHTDVSQQMNNIENLIQQKVNVIIVSPAEVNAVKPAIKEANQAGIPVIMVNLLQPVPGIKANSYIGFDNAQAAEVSAYSVLNELGGPGVLGKHPIKLQPHQYLDLKWWQNLYKNVNKKSIKGDIAVISGISGDFFSNERLRGFHEVVDKFPNVHIVETLPADWNRQKGESAAENILQNHPNIQGIWGASGEMAIGAMIAVQNKGVQNKVWVVSNDGTPESVQDIKDGKLLAETWHGFPEWGWYGVKFGVMLALGEKTPLSYDIRPRTEYKANANDFYPVPKLESINWAQIIKNSKLK